MKINATEEREVFWGIFDEKLIQNGEPFKIIHHRENGEPTYWGNINQKRIFGPNKTLGVEFRFRDKKIRVGIYLLDDLFLFERLYATKERIECELGFSVEWSHIGTQNPNTRRIYTEFDLELFDANHYAEKIDEILPYVVRFKEVFGPRIPNLFDE